MAVFWTGGCQADFIDHHHYPEPQVPYDLGDIAAQQRKPFLQGEYGGFSSAIAEHQWNKTGCSRVISGHARPWGGLPPLAGAEQAGWDDWREVTTPAVAAGDTGMQVSLEPRPRVDLVLLIINSLGLLLISSAASVHWLQSARRGSTCEGSERPGIHADQRYRVRALRLIHVRSEGGQG